MVDLKKNNSLIVQDNSLTKARYKLSRSAQRLIWNLVSKFHHREDDKFHRHFFKISDLYKLLKVEHYAPELKKKKIIKILKELQRNLIEIPSLTNSETLLITSWIEAPEINFKENWLSLRGAEHLQPFFLHLYKNFTSCLYSEIATLTGAHSFRFLIFCRDFAPRPPKYYDKIINGRYVKIEEFDLIELRKILKIPDGIYPKISDFKKRILEASQKEVNKKTSAYFEFEMLKDPADNRKTKSVRLLIFGASVSDSASQSENPNSKLPVLDQKGRQLCERMTVLGVSEQFQGLFLGLYDLTSINLALEAIDEYQENKKINYPDGILNAALSGGWLSNQAAASLLEEQKTANKLLEKEAAKSLKEGLEQKTARDEKKLIKSSAKQISDYQLKLKRHKEYFLASDDKIAIIISLLPEEDRNKLDFEQKDQLRIFLKQKLESGADFEALNSLAVLQILTLLFS